MSYSAPSTKPLSAKKFTVADSLVVFRNLGAAKIALVVVDVTSIAAGSIEVVVDDVDTLNISVAGVTTRLFEPSSNLSIQTRDAGAAWELTGPVFLQNFSVAAEEIFPTGLFFKPDGLKMYITGFDGDDVNEYDLSTAWDISTAVFLQSFSILAQTSVPISLFFRADGSKMYTIDANTGVVLEYDLSTAWDVSTAVFLQNFSVAAQDTSPKALFFRADGLKMYITGGGGNDVNEYDLSTAWDISTAVFLQLFSVAAQDTSPTGLFFKPDGLKMFVVGDTGNDVNEYDLSTAWDVSTAVFVRVFSVAAQETQIFPIFFRSDGLKMYISGGGGDDVNEYDVVADFAGSVLVSAVEQ